MLYRKIMVFVS